MNRRITTIAISVTLAASFVGAGTASAVTNGEKCAAAKIKAASKYAACRLAADSKAQLTGVAASYTVCDAAQLAAWTKAETKYGVECLTSGDQASEQTTLGSATDCVSSHLAGTPGSCSFTSKPPCPVAGAVVGGVCWVMGIPGDSCSAACGAVQMTYDTATDTYAGTTSGDLSHCLAVLSALGHPMIGNFYIQGPPQPIGCSFYGGNPFLIGGAVTDQGNYAGFARACACH